MGLHFNWISKIAENVSNILGIPWSVGDNSFGCLGDNTITSRSSPVSIVGNRSYSQVVFGGSRSLGLEASTGIVWMWGVQYGDGTTQARSSPVSILGGKSFKEIANMYATSFGIEGSTGYAWAWGSNSIGELGNGNAIWRSSPVRVNGDRSYSKIIGYGSSVYGLEASTGFVWAWGNNQFGQLGDNGNFNRSLPVSIYGARSYSKIKPAYNRFHGIEGSTGYIWSCGENTALGNGNPNNQSIPVSILGGKSYKDIIAGTYSSYGLEASTGYAWAWGMNDFGQLGDGTTNWRSSPVSVLGGRSFNKLISNSKSCCGIEASTGHIYSWGYNNSGQLGDNTTNNRSSPVSILSGKSFKEIVITLQTIDYIDYCSVLGLDELGFIWSWGLNNNGQLGDGTITDRSSPVSVIGGRSFNKVIELYGSGKNNIFIE